MRRLTTLDTLSAEDTWNKLNAFDQPMVVQQTNRASKSGLKKGRNKKQTLNVEQSRTHFKALI